MFLSHDHKDNELIEFAILLFMKEKAGIYIDHKDPNMTAITKPETSKKLKIQMDYCSNSLPYPAVELCCS